MAHKSLPPFFLSEDSIKWAIRHIVRFGDTDILPAPLEFRAALIHVHEIAKRLSLLDINKHYYQVPRRVASPKPTGGFRVASQLSPSDAILFTALANFVAPQIEEARLPRSLLTSCSFRLDINANGQFFVPGFGYDDFNKATEINVRRPEIRYVLSVDLADFYNQISHHRIANNMESVGIESHTVMTVEKTLDCLASNHHSRGLPIGPAASIIFAEAATLDIDEFIRGKGVSFCRYVDDFRFFFQDKTESNTFLAQLTEVLFTNHRLATNTTKTKLWSKDAFGSEIVDGEALEEERKQLHLMAMIRSKSDSCAAVDENFISNSDRNEATRKAIDELFARAQKSEPLLVGLAKFVLQRGKALRTAEFASKLVEKLDHFAPVVTDVVDYITTIDAKNKKGLLRQVYDWLSKNSVFSNSSFMQEWTGHLAAKCVESLFPQWEDYEQSCDKLPSSVKNRYSPLAAARMMQRGFIRSLKERIDSQDEAAKRSIILSTCILADDEKKHWLSRFQQSNDVLLDACVLFARNSKTLQVL